MCLNERYQPGFKGGVSFRKKRSGVCSHCSSRPATEPRSTSESKGGRERPSHGFLSQWRFLTSRKSWRCTSIPSITVRIASIWQVVALRNIRVDELFAGGVFDGHFAMSILLALFTRRWPAHRHLELGRWHVDSSSPNHRIGGGTVPPDDRQHHRPLPVHRGDGCDRVLIWHRRTWRLIDVRSGDRGRWHVFGLGPVV